MRRPAITFDTNIPAVPSIRAFWGAICEDIGQRMVLTPTAAAELLTRVRLEAEREWDSRLKRINAEQHLGWTKREMRRLSTAAATAARDWMREEMGRQGAIYAVTSRPTETVEALEAELYDVLPEHLFDLTTGNGIRDRKIVIEALSRGFDILASNNIDSIDHELLREWIKGGEGQRLGLTATILRPQRAESRLRGAYDRPVTWTATALARASVTDPDKPDLAAQEMAEALGPFAERGMGELRKRIERMLLDPHVFAAALDSVRKQGSSLAMRANARMNGASAKAASRRAGMSL